MNWALLISSLIPIAVQGIPSLSGATKQIINDITSSISAILKSGVVQQQNPTTVLSALAGVVASLKSEPNIPQDVLDLIGALDRAALAALAADQIAQQAVDPSKLQPITPV